MLKSNSPRISFLGGLTLILFLTYGSVAHATLFDFSGGSEANAHGLDTGDLGASLDVAQSGITLTVEAFGEPGVSGQIHRNSNGLGVADAPNGNAVGGGESLRFSFSGPAVSVQGLIFERGNENGRLDLYIDDTFHETIHWETGGGTLVAHNLGSITGSQIELRGDRRSFRVNSLSVTSAVPEPSSALLFGLGTLVATRFRRLR